MTDSRSGKVVQLYGTVDGCHGSDVNSLTNLIVSYILPYSRAPDHILDNDPSDYEIYFLLEKVLKDVYKLDINNIAANTYQNGTHSSDDSSGSSRSLRSRNSSMGNLLNGNSAQSEKNVQIKDMMPSQHLLTNEKLAEKLNNMDFCNVYKDAVEGVDEAAEEDDSEGIKSHTLFAFGPSSTLQSALDASINCDVKGIKNHSCMDISNLQSLVQQNSKYSDHSLTHEGASCSRKFVSCVKSVPIISACDEKVRSENEKLETCSMEQKDIFLHNLAIRKRKCSELQYSPIEVSRKGDDDSDMLMEAIEEAAINLGLIESDTIRSTENISDESEERSSVGSTVSHKYVLSHASVAIVLVYGDKMFIGSIGDSRIVLVRKKGSYIDIMYLNEPPTDWVPVACEKDAFPFDKHPFIFRQPVIQGAFSVSLKPEEKAYFAMDGIADYLTAFAKTTGYDFSINCVYNMLHELLNEGQPQLSIDKTALRNISNMPESKMNKNHNSTEQSLERTPSSDHVKI
ncbi:unnamed protein product [Thelazia callipaeda]|uniref:PPM-type phosphatase domain-containing protein n=1 Tax=Thelazia callipaeda TaxID=103827 RepID=A0A0N5D3L9_THECL|nr:unnamed protein product [Thelazia callipaeda]